MTNGPERPWANSAWDGIVVHGPPWWRRLLTGPLVALFVLVLLLPFGTTIWWLFLAHEEREAIGAPWYRYDLGGFEPGDCVDEVAGGVSLRPASCTAPHDGEITGIVVLDPGPYPGEDAVLNQSDERCGEATERWVEGGSGADLDLDVAYYYPVLGLWDEARPTSLCLALGAAGQQLIAPLSSRGS